MPTSAATVPVSACFVVCPACSWLIIVSTATGTIAQVTYRKMRLMPSMSSERTTVKRRASAASLRAYASSPTAMAW